MDGALPYPLPEAPHSSATVTNLCFVSLFRCFILFLVLHLHVQKALHATGFCPLSLQQHQAGILAEISILFLSTV